MSEALQESKQDGNETTQVQKSSAEDAKIEIIDPIIVDTPERKKPQEEEIPVKDGWKYDDELSGSGDAPEWFLKDKYGSVAEQAKALVHAQKKLGELTGSPKDGYTYDNVKGIDADSPLIKQMSTVFQDMGMSQKGFDRIANAFMTLQQSISADNAPKVLAELGAGGQETVTRVNQWLANNFSKEEQSIVQSWMLSGKDVRILDRLRANLPRARLPTSNEADLGNAHAWESLSQVKAEKTANWARFKTDKHYRDQITARFRDAAMREGIDN